MKPVDVAVVGGGPAGLAAGIEAARAGLSVRVLERQPHPPDKACGEGLMPPGLAALEQLGVAPSMLAGRSAPFAGIRYVQEDGSRVEAAFRGGPGLGIRRLVLVEAMTRLAREAGVEVLHGVAVRSVVPREEVVEVEGEQPFEARLVVAADGLASPLRRAANLEISTPGPRRFGLRRHYRGLIPPNMVEVHWTTGAEAYITPIGSDEVGLAFLLADDPQKPASFEALLGRFPVLKEWVGKAEPSSEVRGAGPLARACRSVVSGRLVLLGDAAGYVDAITGEGLSLAFASARALGEVLRPALAEPSRLRAYEEAHRALFRRYRVSSRALLALSARPQLRKVLFHTASALPPLFAAALDLVASP